MNEDQLTETCVECGRIWDDHLVSEYRTHWPKARPGVSLPFEEIPTDQPSRVVKIGEFADHFTLMTSVAELPPEAARMTGERVYGALTFDFSNGSRLLTSQTLLGDMRVFRELRQLTSAAVDQLAVKIRKRR